MQKRPLILAALGALATAVAFAVAAIPSAHAATPVRIMPLGDSITGSPGCWRALLWNRLQNNGYTDIDMVGTLGPQGCGIPYDGDNEGHGGYLVTNVADQNQLVGWLSATNPDIVIMHFGTNDVWSNRSTDQILAAYSKLVDQMRANNANMKILVAQIIPVAPPSCPECPTRTVALNNAIPGWAASKTTAQSPITVVDQWTGWVPSTDTGDGVHPNDSGNQKMSDHWYPALAAALDGTTPPGDTQAPTVPGTPTASNVTSSSVTLSWAASSDNVGVAGYDIYRAVGSGSFASVGTASGTSFTNSGLAAATTYRYQVRARDAAGNTSAFSPAVSVTTQSGGGDITPPTTPGTPVASNITSSSVTLTWTPSTDNVGVVGYDIYRAPGASGGTFASVGTSVSNSFTNSGLAASTTYRYQVRARDAAGSVSPFSAAVTVTTQSGGGGTGGCTASYSVTNSWPGGFQGEVIVSNTGSTATTSWTVTLTFAAGQRITQIWNARTSSTASPYTITNESYNGTIGVNGSTSFGFLGSWSNSNPAPTLSCTRTP